MRASEFHNRKFRVGPQILPKRCLIVIASELRMLRSSSSNSEPLAVPDPRFEPILRLQMPELDSVRGLAILLVVFYHGYFWSNGITGLAVC